MSDPEIRDLLPHPTAAVRLRAPTSKLSELFDLHLPNIADRLGDMGVDPALWLHALDTPPESLYFLSPEEQRQFRLVTAPSLARV